MMFDLLSTCYSDYISISRPQTLLNNSFEDERELSPVHLSSAISTSSRITCFSQRLVELDKKQNENNIKLAMGRGRGIETSLVSTTKELDDDSIAYSNATSPIPSIVGSSEYYFYYK